MILDGHDLLEGEVGIAFDRFVLKALAQQGVQVEEFAAAVQALNKLRDTLAELQSLPE